MRDAQSGAEAMGRLFDFAGHRKEFYRKPSS